jgi:asparagine synthase (glutamine-hydrolysing)
MDKEIFKSLFSLELSHLGAMAVWQQSVSLPDDMLHKVDRMSMAHSLEVRAPFLDRRLLTLANKISFKAKLRGGLPKYTLRRALETYLPPDIVWRKKKGFDVPMSQWLKGDLAGFIRSRLTERDALTRAIIPPAVLHRMLDEHARGVRDWGQALWTMLMFESWARAYGVTSTCLA